MVSSYSKAKVRHLIRLITGGPKKQHFHVEIALPSWFPARSPKPTEKISAVQQMFSRLIGEGIALNVWADFLIDSDQLPEKGPIRILSAKAEAAGTTIELTGGVLSVVGSVINRISWARVSEKQTQIQLRAAVETTVRAGYLYDSHDLIERFFRVLLMGQPAAGD